MPKSRGLVVFCMAAASAGLMAQEALDMPRANERVHNLGQWYRPIRLNDRIRILDPAGIFESRGGGFQSFLTGQAFYSNAVSSGYYYPVVDQTADDIGFGGAHNVTGFQFAWFAPPGSGTSDATIRFYDVSPTLRPGNLLRSYTATGLLDGSHFMDVDLAAIGQSFTWNDTSPSVGFGWMSVTFTNGDFGWICSDGYTVGVSQDVFYSFADDSFYYFGPGVHASFWAKVYDDHTQDKSVKLKVRVVGWAGEGNPAGDPFGVLPVAFNVGGLNLSVTTVVPDPVEQGVGSFTVMVPSTGCSVRVKPRGFLSEFLPIEISGGVPVPVTYDGDGDPTVDSPGMRGGDVDDNNLVEDADLIDLILDFGSPGGSTSGFPATDNDGDGIVQDGDLINVILYFGQSGF